MLSRSQVGHSGNKPQLAIMIFRRSNSSWALENECQTHGSRQVRTATASNQGGVMPRS